MISFPAKVLNVQKTVEIVLNSLHLEFLEVGATFLSRRSHDIQEVWCEHKRNPLLADSHEALIIPQDVTKVDVEEIPCSNKKETNI